MSCRQGWYWSGCLTSCGSMSREHFWRRAGRMQAGCGASGISSARKMRPRLCLRSLRMSPGRSGCTAKSKCRQHLIRCVGSANAPTSPSTTPRHGSWATSPRHRSIGRRQSADPSKQSTMGWQRSWRRLGRSSQRSRTYRPLRRCSPAHLRKLGVHTFLC